MNCLWHVFALVCYFIHAESSSVVQVDRPRGVSLTKKVLYNPTQDFTCLDGKRTIDFKLVNDDYCDCDDGSDEPGTSACPNGLFHCTNAGYRPINIPSSRVNDGICDCCDGSDEWNKATACPNTCIDLRRLEMEQQRQQMEEYNQGFILRQEFTKAGQAKKVERMERIKELEVQISDLKAAEESLKTEKEAIEAQESEAVNEHNRIVEEQRAKAAYEEDQKRGNEAFAEMDEDRDASLSFQELLPHDELDPETSDGVFTAEEAQSVLQGETVDLPQFMENVWSAINGTFQTKLQPPMEEQEDLSDGEQVADGTEAERDSGRELLDEVLPTDEQPTSDDEEFGDEDEPYDEEDDEEGDDYDEDSEYDDKQEKTTEPSPPAGGVPYDEATKVLIERATEARNKYNANQDEKKEAEKTLENFKKEVEMDFGSDEAFQVLQSQCFELITKEYVYKLCPFDKTTQSPKNGGSDTVLGRWGSWAGPPENLHSRMKYDNGVVCWNGPARSTEVRIRCGVDHKLLSVDEPSRCAYLFEFATPCACAHVVQDDTGMPRDEL